MSHDVLFTVVIGENTAHKLTQLTISVTECRVAIEQASQ